MGSLITHAKTNDDTANKGDEILNNDTKSDTQSGIDLLRLFTDATRQGTCRMLIFIEVCNVLAQYTAKDAQSEYSGQILGCPSEAVRLESDSQSRYTSAVARSSVTEYNSAPSAQMLTWRKGVLNSSHCDPARSRCRLS